MDPLGRLQGVVALAAPPEPPPGEGPEWGKAAPIGLLVILLLCAAMWLLFRNMSKHLRKVREAAAAEEAGSAAPGRGAAGTDPNRIAVEDEAGDDDDHGDDEAGDDVAGPDGAGDDGAGAGSTVSISKAAGITDARESDHPARDRPDRTG